jgi:hypothetical protein
MEKFMPVTDRVHFFHADASALGGYLVAPIKQTVPLQAPLSLAPAGGYASSRVDEAFHLAGVISFETAYTQVSGKLSDKEGHGWVTLVSSVVEGLNVLDVVTVDRVVAQITTEHPLVGDNPTVSFLGSQFENLKIAGRPIEAVLDLGICGQDAGENGYPQEPCVSDKQFQSRVSSQYREITNAKSIPPWAKDRTIPDWLSSLYQWNNSTAANKGSILCSVVKDTNGEFSGTPFGHVLEVPGFGKIFLGQLIVDCKSYQLNMIHVEMGCTGQGQVDAANATANGSTYPP